MKLRLWCLRNAYFYVIRQHYCRKLTESQNSQFQAAPDCLHYAELDGPEDRAQQLLLDEGWGEILRNDGVSLLACPACQRHAGGREAITKLSTTEITSIKNRLILELQHKKQTNLTQLTRALAAEIAPFEQELAQRDLAQNEFEKACIGFISQASLLVDADQKDEAIRIYQYTHKLTSSADIPFSCGSAITGK